MKSGSMSSFREAAELPDQEDWDEGTSIEAQVARANDSSGYSARLEPDEQISAEEAIASLIFEYQESEAQMDKDGDPIRLDEEDTAELGRRILLLVLKEFCPDLIEEANHA